MVHMCDNSCTLFASAPNARMNPSRAPFHTAACPTSLGASRSFLARVVERSLGCHRLNAKLRRAVRTRGHFPTDESAMKLLYLVLNLGTKDWKMPPREWSMAHTQLAILFEDQFTLA